MFSNVYLLSFSLCSFPFMKSPLMLGLLPLVTVDHIWSRHFWLGGLDSRSAMRQIISMCVVSCAENIGAHHTQYNQSWFFNLHVGALQIKNLLRFIKSLCGLPPLPPLRDTSGHLQLCLWRPKQTFKAKTRKVSDPDDRIFVPDHKSCIVTKYKLEHWT